MRVRTVISGILAGGICYPILWIHYYRIAPAAFVPGWPYVNTLPQIPSHWIAIAVQTLCGLILFTFGWVAARWNWSKTRSASLLSGAGAGALAGCIIYDLMGVFWFGIQGQAEILQNFYTTLTEAEGTRIMIEAILRTGSLVYSNAILIILASIIIGALGGLASALVDVKDVWGTHPRRPEGWLSRLTAYLLIPFGYLSLYVTVPVLSVLWEKTINSGRQLEEAYDVQWTLGSFDGEAILVFAYAAGLLFILIPISLTWGWFIRNWRNKGKPDTLSILWMLLSVPGTVYLFLRFVPYLHRLIMIPLLIAVMVIGTFIGLLNRLDAPDGSRPTSSDWFGQGLAFGILGATQVIAGSPALALPVTLIGILNIPHLIRGELVEQSPISQVTYLHGFQYNVGVVTILVCFVLGLILAGITSLVRGLFGIRELPASVNTQPASR